MATQGTRLERPLTLTTSSAVSWSIWQGDDFKLERITMAFSDTPSDIANVQLWLDADAGAAFDCILREVDPNNCKYLTIENVDGIANGDKLLLVYDNNEGLTINATATLRL